MGNNDRLAGDPLRGSAMKRTRMISLLLLGWLAIVLAVPGCSLGVMAGKMLFGDPLVPAPFRNSTGVDLTEGDHKVLILCTTPYGVSQHYPGLKIDLVDRLSRMLKNKNIQVVSPDEVASWYDDHGSWGDFSELSDRFEADFVVEVELRKFTTTVPESEELLQGFCEGHVTVHEAERDSSEGVLSPLRRRFDRVFQVRYPHVHPIPREQRSEDLFYEDFKDRVSREVGRMMYDYRMSDTID